MFMITNDLFLLSHDVYENKQFIGYYQLKSVDKIN